jgi:hypothetical protein
LQHVQVLRITVYVLQHAASDQRRISAVWKHTKAAGNLALST